MAERTDAPGVGWVERRRALGRAIARERRPLARADLAAKLGRPAHVVAQWERGAVELGVDRVYELEQLLGLSPGRLLIAAGYVVPIAPMPWWLDEPDTRRHTPATPDALLHFPRRASEWLRDHGPLIEAIAQLRDSGADPELIESMLTTPAACHLSLGWQIWEGTLGPSAHADELLATALTNEAVGRCRWALWGERANVPVLRLVDP